MQVTKIFRVESSHRVVNCSSERCKYSLHGHSAVIELTMECKTPDLGGMVYDFGLMKGTIKEFIDSMDHCNIFYKYDDEAYVDFIKKFNDRWIELPISPSAEFLSAFIFKACQYILDRTVCANGEGNVKISSVKYHETSTGSATCSTADIPIWAPYELTDVVFSEGVTNDWSVDLYNIWFCDSKISNTKPEQQVRTNW